ncbi:MAG TPA: hypothetical protein ENK43_06715 [Planctomycetes bacterium]|nr:hypothetical protein [Planctomycetota bacterium]
MFSTKKDVIEEMNRMVVVSLHTDGKGPRKDEFSRLREKLTGSITNPAYVVLDPAAPDEAVWVADYNDAKADSFAKKLARARRRVERAFLRRNKVVASTK